MDRKLRQPGGTGTPEDRLEEREQFIANRETWVRAREETTKEHEILISEREELVLLREQALQCQTEVEHGRVEREHLLAQMREANERLVVETLASDALAIAEAEGRQRAEELAGVLRAREHELRTLADTVPMLAWFAEPDGGVAWYNERYYEYTGTTLAEQAGWGWQTIHDATDLSRVIAKWKVALAAGEPWEDIYQLRRRDGAMRWFLGRAQPLRDTGGRIIRWFGTHADIDDQKHAEQAALAASRVKDEFLAMLGHELRNPLAPIVTALDLISTRGDDRHTHEHRIIDRQVKHLSRLVDDLLDVSRITSGKIELRLEPVELADVVGRAVEMVGPLFESNHQQVTVDIAATGLIVDGDPTRLAQAIGNVLVNAAKYTPSRGAIAVGARRHGSTVVLRITDNGIGIAPEMLPRIFELFSQERQAIDRARGGLGLGLAIVQSLVTMHGGHVTAHSDGVGCGSELTIVLPASNLPVLRTRPRHTLELVPLAKPTRLLVVDDNADAAEMLALSLERYGHEVRMAFDGAEALTVGADFKPDVVLLDLGLPVLDGYEVAARMRTLLWPHRVHFIAITGYGQATDRHHTATAGFDGHLVKPVDVATVRASIAQVTRAQP